MATSILQSNTMLPVKPAMLTTVTDVLNLASLSVVEALIINTLTIHQKAASNCGLFFVQHQKTLTYEKDEFTHPCGDDRLCSLCTKH